MNQEALEDLLDELAALNMETMKALQAIAFISGEPDAYKAKILDAGLRDLDLTNYGGVAAERRDVFVEKARARYTDIIAGLALPNRT